MGHALAAHFFVAVQRWDSDLTKATGALLDEGRVPGDAPGIRPSTQLTNASTATASPMPAGLRPVKPSSAEPNSGPPKNRILRLPHIHHLRPPQRLQRLQQRGQSALPLATAFELGFQGGERERRGAAGQGFGHGADLFGQRGGPRVLLGWLDLLCF